MAGEVSGGVRWTLLQSDARTRVLRLDEPDHPPLVLKTYAYPSHLAWRTVGMVARANREFTVMMEAHRLGLPVARPRYWLEQRVFGGLRFSALALDQLEGPHLEAELARPTLTGEARRNHARQAGALLGRFHRAGLNWGTAAPRNLLMTADGDREPLRAIDMPYATLDLADITGSDDAMLDLETLLRMSDGAVAFEGADQEALLLAYCEDDDATARALAERIVLHSHLSWKRQRLRRRVRNLLRPGTRSAGPAGCYDDVSGAYERLNDTGVYLAR